MRKLNIAVLMILGSLVPAAADSSSSKYPLQVSIFTSSPKPGSAGKAGTGKANVKEGDSYVAVEFTYQCELPFLSYGMERPYPGAWKEKNKVLTLHVTKVADPETKVDCDLPVNVLPTLFAEKKGVLTSVSPTEFRQLTKKQVKADKEKKEESSAPMSLKVSIVQSDWAAMGSMRVGSGKGNVTEKGRTTGFEFSAHCPARTLRNPPNADYVGRWAEDKTKIVTVIPGSKDPDGLTCELEIQTRTVVYEKAADGKLAETPIAQYNKGKKK